MRKLVHAALGTIVAAAAVVATAPQALANTCATAYPLGTAGAAEMGTQTRVGAVGTYWPEEWWEHSTQISGRLVSLTALDGAAKLEVYDASCPVLPVCFGSASSTIPATCTIPQTGLYKLRVLHDPAGGPGSNYSLTALGNTPTECNDGIDNDGDDWIDAAADPHCTSPTDNTESEVHLAAYGHITVETNNVGVPKMTLTGVYADASAFQCEMQYSPKIQAVCIEKSDPEVAYDCTSFILTANAYSTTSPSGPGTVRGHLTCDSGNVLETGDVTTGSQAVNNHWPAFIDLGGAIVVRCRAAGVNGATNATGAYKVDCYEPGVAWPVETVRDPRG